LGGAVVFGAFAAASWPLLRDARAWVRILGPALAWAGIEWLAVRPVASFPVTAGALIIDSPALPVAQIAGVHGLSFLLVLSAASVADALSRGLTPTRLLSAAAPAVLSLGLGAALAAMPPAPTGTVRYRAIQPNIPFELSSGSWLAPSHRGQLRDGFAAQIRAAAASDAELVLWPEGAEMLSAFEPERTHRWLPELYGGPAFLVSSTDLSPTGERRNRVWGFQGDAASQVYQKTWLVPVAERDYQPGTDAHGVFRTAAGNVGALVCFETCFPDPARRRIDDGASLLFSSTNDGAFDRTGVPLWHRAAAFLRAAETGRTVLHVSNRGPSSEIDATGRLLRELPFGRTGLLEGRADLHGHRTIFVAWGHLFAPLALVVLLVLLVLRRPVAAPAATPLGWRGTLVIAMAPLVGIGVVGASVRHASDGALGLADLRGPTLATPPLFAPEGLQQTPNTCGPAVLAYLLSYLGDPVNEDEILRHVTVHPRGTTLRDLRDAAVQLGYRARGEHVDYAELVAAPLPRLAHFDDAHYVAVLRADADGVDLFDPLIGVVRLARTDFVRRWTGNILAVEPAELTPDSQRP
jgi:apolipoprotein N-acyltransferase